MQARYRRVRMMSISTPPRPRRLPIVAEERMPILLLGPPAATPQPMGCGPGGVPPSFQGTLTPQIQLAGGRRSLTLRFGGCLDDTSVVRFFVAGLGHEWPNREIDDGTDPTVSVTASDLLWDEFKQHHR
jgi:hypothetical protein